MNEGPLDLRTQTRTHPIASWRSTGSTASGANSGEVVSTPAGTEGSAPQTATGGGSAVVSVPGARKHLIHFDCQSLSWQPGGDGLWRHSHRGSHRRRNTGASAASSGGRAATTPVHSPGEVVDGKVEVEIRRRTHGFHQLFYFSVRTEGVLLHRLDFFSLTAGESHECKMLKKNTSRLFQDMSFPLLGRISFAWAENDWFYSKMRMRRCVTSELLGFFLLVAF